MEPHSVKRAFLLTCLLSVIQIVCIYNLFFIIAE